MKTLIIISTILIIVGWVIIRFKRKKIKKSNIMNTLTKDSTYQILQELQNVMGTDTTQNGMIPGAYGNFGHDVTNPILVKGTMGEIAYLAKLKTEKGVKVEYKRTGSTMAENISHPIDTYEIRGEGKHICRLYLCPYYIENSANTPQGFKLIRFE